MSYDYKIITGNCLDKLKELEDNSIDAIVTDPPYELGFMGKKWDNTGVAYNVELWKECLRVLKHGGHLLSFGGTRTYHRMTCAIEDAGFEIRDCVFYCYGSGFPKSQNIAKMIEGKLTIGSANTTAFKKLNGERKNITNGYTKMEYEQGNKPSNYNKNDNGGSVIKPIFTTKEAQYWEGWGTALKPAVEPIVMARKPLKEKTIVENVIKWGVGGINIDESRIGTDQILTCGGRKGGVAYGDWKEKINEYHQGRFPANLIWTHHPDCKCVGTKEVNSNAHYPEMNVTGYGKNFGGKTEYVAEGERPKSEIVESWECVAGCPSKEFDKAGVSKTKANENYKWNNVNCENANTFRGRGVYTPRNDEGTPGRFFKSFSYEQEDLDYAPFYYCAKASKSERNEGLDGFEDTERKNFHPTVKPIKLMEYLIKMVTPKGGVVLDPFMGSGTTGCACVKNGYKFIGIEMTEEYIPIAEARIKAHVPTQQKLEGIE